MKALILKLLVISPIFFLSGCFFCPEPEILVQTKTKYVKAAIPEILEPPTPIEYDMKFIKFNDESYYFMSLYDGNIMKSNWERYKLWSDNNHGLLKALKNDYDSNTTIITEIK